MYYNKEKLTNFLLKTSIYLIFSSIYDKIMNIINSLKEKIFKSSLKSKEIIYFDFETTGLNPFHDKIIEYCFMIEDGTTNTSISSIVNPERKMEKIITNITGIHPDMFEGKENIKYHIKNIYQFINGKVHNSFLKLEKKYLVAHNAKGFDEIFLKREFYENSIDNNFYTDNIYYIDTLLLARRLLPKLKSHSLKSLAKHFNVEQGTHRAEDDVICMRVIFHKLVEIISKNTNTPSDYYFENPDAIINFYEYTY